MRRPDHDQPRLTIEDRGERARDGRFVLRIHDLAWASRNRERLVEILDAIVQEGGRHADRR